MTLIEFTFVILILTIICLFVIKISMHQDSLYDTIIYEFHRPTDPREIKIAELRNKEKELMEEREILLEKLRELEEKRARISDETTIINT